MKSIFLPSREVGQQTKRFPKLLVDYKEGLKRIGKYLGQGR